LRTVPPSPRAARRAGRALPLIAVLATLAALGVAAWLILGQEHVGEAAAPDSAVQPAAAPAVEESTPVVPRFELGRGSEGLAPGERPPLAQRQSLPPEERFRGEGRIEGYLDLPSGMEVPRPWTLVLEPSKVLIGGDRAEGRRLTFEQGEREFALEHVPLGGYQLRAEAANMSGAPELLLLARPDAHDVTVHVALRPAAFVEGWVEDADGAPVEGVTMVLDPLAGGATRTARTDVRGGYRFENVPDGEHRLSAGRVPSPLAEPLDLAVSPPSVSVPRIVVPRLGELEIAVLDSAGSPVAGVTLEGWGSGGGTVDATTDVQGVALARHLPAGRITVNAWIGEGDARRIGRGVAELDAGARAALEIHLVP
jgi:Carboxypeptidase regulatory-like domain